MHTGIYMIGNEENKMIMMKGNGSGSFWGREGWRGGVQRVLTKEDAYRGRMRIFSFS